MCVWVDGGAWERLLAVEVLLLLVVAGCWWLLLVLVVVGLVSGNKILYGCWRAGGEKEKLGQRGDGPGALNSRMIAAEQDVSGLVRLSGDCAETR